EQRYHGEGGPHFVGLRQPGQRSDAPARASPRPVIDLDLLDRGEVSTRLPNPHRRRPLSSTRARGPTQEGKDATRHPASTVPRESATNCVDCGPKEGVTMQPPALRFLREPPGRPGTA